MDEIFEKMHTLEQRILVLEGIMLQKPIPRVLGTKEISPKEFLITQKPKGEVECTFFLFCYEEYIAGKEASSSADIKLLYRRAKVAAPVNINATINKNVAKGFLTEAEKQNGRKTWMVTLTGEELYKGQSL